jgi:hypothetical protein
MPTYPIKFEKTFTIIVEASSKNEAIQAAKETLSELGSCNWETGEWDFEVGQESILKPDHFVRRFPEHLEILNIADKPLREKE